MNLNVLVFPCGSEIGLEVHKALQFAKGINLIGGSSVKDHGRMVYSNYIEDIPNVKDDDFVDKINSLVCKYKINYIIPAHDSVVLKLAQHSEEISAEIITSEKYTCEVCRSKKKTYEVFCDEDFTPHMYLEEEEIEEFPVFMKPDVGQGSVGIALAKNENEMKFNLEKDNSLLVLEYLPGKEYTIDCFTNSKGELLFIGQRGRNRIKSGISVNSEVIKPSEEVINIANIINNKLKFRGAWFFQVKEDKQGKLKLLEIAPRIAGTMSLHRNYGCNFPLMSIYDREGYEVSVINNNFVMEVDRALTNRFNINYDYENVFIDFDDTITLKGKANPLTMMFLYQCVEKEKKIYLITKHVNDIYETLEQIKIDKNIFTEIIRIKREEDKHKYLKDVANNNNGIFIDDSYAERAAISKELSIPVFDVDALEALIDWRR